MPIQAQVEGIGTLEFPDGTDPSVIQSTVKKQIALKNPPQEPGLSTGESVKQTAIGAGKEVAGQAAGLTSMVGPQGIMNVLSHPRETKDAVVAGARSVGHAIAHPIDTAEDALTGFMEKVLPTPKTAQQAQERGAALVR